MDKKNQLDQDIEDIKNQKFQTKRATVPELEEILYDPFPVLDHGFVRVIDYMGDDSAIVQAARVSYGKGTKKLREDQGLINYLKRHRHTTPFEMCSIKFHIKLPIFVARQWIRHRTASVNEYSARYSILDNEFYIPSPEHLAAQSTSNRQGRGEIITGQQAHDILELLKEESLTAYSSYQGLLNLDEAENVVNEEKMPLARELARMVLPLNFYTQWYWKVNLHNLMHFLALRADPHAQYEIRVYADVMLKILEKWVPSAFAAFEEYHLHGVHVSRKGMDVIKRMLNGEEVSASTMGMSLREWNELMALLK